MERPDFSRPLALLVANHLYDDVDAIDGDAVKGLQHGLLG